MSYIVVLTAVAAGKYGRLIQKPAIKESFQKAKKYHIARSYL